MVDSKLVLTGQTLAYTFYCIVIILVVIWFTIKVTGKGKGFGSKTGSILHICWFSDSAWCILTYYHI